MIFYLSGKISDVTKSKERENMEVFNAAERDLVARGVTVFNPAKLECDGKPWEWYLARDLKWINDYRPMLYMLPGWQDSRGSRLEVAFAQLLGLQILYPIGRTE